VGGGPAGTTKLPFRKLNSILRERRGKTAMSFDRPPGNCRRACRKSRLGARNGAAAIASTAMSSSFSHWSRPIGHRKVRWQTSLRHYPRSLKFDFTRDIVPIAGIDRTPDVMEVNPSFPAKTVPVAYAKANPGKINMATTGTGGGPHLHLRALPRAGFVRTVMTARS
jgi:hypothetical protein